MEANRKDTEILQVVKLHAVQPSRATFKVKAIVARNLGLKELLTLATSDLLLIGIKVAENSFRISLREQFIHFRLIFQINELKLDEEIKKTENCA